MVDFDKIISKMKQNPENVGFKDLCKLCNHFFGKPCINANGYMVYETPWEKDQRLNIQNNKGKAKAYQVKRVLLAIESLEDISEIPTRSIFVQGNVVRRR
jgi:hypothetical protein